MPQQIIFLNRKKFSQKINYSLNSLVSKVSKFEVNPSVNQAKAYSQCDHHCSRLEMNNYRIYAHFSCRRRLFGMLNDLLHDFGLVLMRPAIKKLLRCVTMCQRNQIWLLMKLNFISKKSRKFSIRHRFLAHQSAHPI